MENNLNKLIAYHAQLIDLKCGTLDELVLTRENSEAVDILLEALNTLIKEKKMFLKRDDDFNNEAEYEKANI